MQTRPDGHAAAVLDTLVLTGLWSPLKAQLLLSQHRGRSVNPVYISAPCTHRVRVLQILLLNRRGERTVARPKHFFPSFLQHRNCDPRAAPFWDPHPHTDVQVISRERLGGINFCGTMKHPKSSNQTCGLSDFRHQHTHRQTH